MFFTGHGHLTVIPTHNSRHCISETVRQTRLTHLPFIIPFRTKTILYSNVSIANDAVHGRMPCWTVNKFIINLLMSLLSMNIDFYTKQRRDWGLLDWGNYVIPLYMGRRLPLGLQFLCCCFLGEQKYILLSPSKLIN